MSNYAPAELKRMAVEWTIADMLGDPRAREVVLTLAVLCPGMTRPQVESNIREIARA